MSSVQWRLATFKELVSLLWGHAPSVEMGLCKSHELLESAYAAAFDDARLWYWSSDIVCGGDKIHVVDFRDGFLGFAGKGSVGSVRLVSTIKSNAVWACGDCASLRYEQLANGVRDNKTGLVWQKSAMPEKLSLKDVVQIKEGLMLNNAMVA